MADHIGKLIKDLAEMQVGFYVYYPAPFGQRTVHVTPEQLVHYADDPVGYLAEHYSVSREDYLAWHRSGYTVTCSGFTKTGRRCKATVSGLSLVNEPRIWVEGQGGRCNVHG